VESARLAEPCDLDQVAQLWASAEGELAHKRGGRLLARSVTPTQGVRAALAAAVAGAGSVLAVGALDEVIVGFGYGRLAASGSAVATGELVAPGAGRAAGPIGMIEVLYVEPAARGVGVGEAVVGILLERFEAFGCLGVDAFALPGSREAKAFFETHGFVTRALVMHRPIRSEG
jgi:ribosomal protein S18 acetylase RimI-like enzyme